MMTIRMPGTSFHGPMLPLTAEQEAIKMHLDTHIRVLAHDIGERHLGRYLQLEGAMHYLTDTLQALGYQVHLLPYRTHSKVVYNIEVEHKGAFYPDEILIIGAHYDTVPGSPGANDNGSGIAALLELARLTSTMPLRRTVRFVAFVNEEPPYFHTEEMGSYVYAEACKEKNERIVGMISLETMGYFSDEPHSQQYPFPLNLLYPDTANFIGFVSNTTSHALLTKTIQLFREHAAFPSEGGAVPAYFTGVGFSDHWSFWEMGYPALMVTDTAFFRYPHYHSSRDTVDKVNTEALARITQGLATVIEILATEKRPY